MIETKKVFISGPMSGIEDCNRTAFMEAEILLKRAGFDVFNPIIFAGLEGWSESEIMDLDLTALSKCNAIYQLDGWENSGGANVEWAYAKKCGLEVINHSWLDWYDDEMWKMANRDLCPAGIMVDEGA